MKVILSRKGFDSSYGGFPSPILPDGTLLSLPIPSPGDGIRFSDLRLDETQSIFDIMLSLRKKINLPRRGRFPLTDTTECHLDPDLYRSVLERETSWKPLFGQINQAQSHLENQNVGEGDLFLFFGWFRQTQKTNGTLEFVPDAPDLHVIYGYLQIQRVEYVNEDSEVPTWMRYHPHVARKERRQSSTNAIYVASDVLSWNMKRSGAGVLNFSDTTVLTKKGETRSRWALPEFFRDLTITYHSKKSWNPNGYFESAKRGQEFVMEEDRRVTRWAKTLIDTSSRD